ncbi:SRPBCC family protein [Kineococcus gynurae]|uniref:SRPBCC family protein n=1 Tax=Kineococcus gynurae TaxID=452979 RepID=A0ABV5LNL8_9ACTN
MLSPGGGSTVRIRTRVPAPPEQVHDACLDMDLHRASLAGSAETATTSSGSARLGVGDEVTFSARHLGRRWSMTARVTEGDRPHRFVDEQVRGPFGSFRHVHEFRADGGGGTVMTDEVTFRPPLPPLGLVAVPVLRWYLRRLLRRRARFLARRFDQ